MLFALLAILAPSLGAPLAGSEFERYISVPADPRSDAATLVSATLSITEDLDEEADEQADQEEATFLALATLHCAPDAEYQTADARLPAFPHLSSHSCTGPPTL